MMMTTSSGEAFEGVGGGDDAGEQAGEEGEHGHEVIGACLPQTNERDGAGDDGEGDLLVGRSS